MIVVIRDKDDARWAKAKMLRSVHFRGSERSVYQSCRATAGERGQATLRINQT